MFSKNLIKYSKSLHLKKNRFANHQFIVEGEKIVKEFIQSDNQQIFKLFAVQKFIEANLAIIKKKKIDVIEVSLTELAQISALNSPNEAVAIVKMQSHDINYNTININGALYLDNLQDPGNLGTIIRTADWFGFKEVLCSPNSVDVYNPKVIQATMGAILRVNVNYIEFLDLEANIKKTSPNFPIFGAVLNGNSIFKTNLKPGLIVIGNESQGISKHIVNHITFPITIPAQKNNGTESLNAACATAIICSEFFKHQNLI